MIAKIPFEDTRRTGYQFGERIKPEHTKYPNTFHCGLDANQGVNGAADEGSPFGALGDGVVVYCRESGAGWGNLIVIEHPEFSKLWPTGYIASRIAHGKELKVKVGDTVKMADVLGKVSKTGTGKNGSPHCHIEVIQKKLPTYTHYPNGKGLQYVYEYWVDPEKFVKEINQIHADRMKSKAWFDANHRPEIAPVLQDLDGLMDKVRKAGIPAEELFAAIHKIAKNEATKRG